MKPPVKGTRGSGWSCPRPTDFSFILLIALSGLAPARPAGGISGAEVIDRMQESFAKAKTFSARFEKQLYWAVLDKTLSQKGRIYTRKPGKFRVEVDGGSVVVADGAAIWVYTEKNEQVIVGPYDGELSTPWEIVINYAESFSPLAVAETKLAGHDCYLVTLEPKEREASVGVKGQVVRMKVWVDKKRWYLLRVEELEANGDVRTYTLDDHRAGKKLKEGLFSFEPPDGVEVIDRRLPVGLIQR